MSRWLLILFAVIAGWFPPTAARAITRPHPAGCDAPRHPANDAEANFTSYDSSGPPETESPVTSTMPTVISGRQVDAGLRRRPETIPPQAQDVSRFWTMDTDEGNSGDPLSLHRYLYAGDNPVNLIDPSGRSWVHVGIAFIIVATTLIAFEAANAYERFELNDKDRSDAIDSNNRAMKALEAIIASDGDKSFQDEHLGMIGKFGTVLNDNEDKSFQRVVNVYEFYINMRGWWPALYETFGHVGTGDWRAIPQPGTAGDSDASRVTLAKTLLYRAQSFDRWVRSAY